MSSTVAIFLFSGRAEGWIFSPMETPMWGRWLSFVMPENKMKGDINEKHKLLSGWIYFLLAQWVNDTRHGEGELTWVTGRLTTTFQSNMIKSLYSLSSWLNSLKLPEFVKDFVRTTFQTSSTFPWNFVTMQLLGTGYWSHKIYWIQHAHTKGKNFQIFYCRRYVGSMVEGKMEGKGGLTFKKFLNHWSFFSSQHDPHIK